MNLEGNNETVKASTLLGKKDFIKKAWQVFGLLLQLHEMQEINDDMKRKSYYLQSFILSCIARNIRRTIYGKQKRGHWCLQWAGNNMTHMAFIMLLMDHIKDELFCLHEDTTILRICESFAKTNDEKQTEKKGAYIYFDTNNSVWICSGKVTGRFFLV